MREYPVIVIGAGLAGVECAWQLARHNHLVTLVEARPKWRSAAHSTTHFAELVCSNSLKSEQEGHAAALLKEEMTCFDSLVLRVAQSCRVPAGKVLAVDRSLFSEKITSEIENNKAISVLRAEVLSIGRTGEQHFHLVIEEEGGQRELQAAKVVVATGPLTSPSLSDSLKNLLGDDYLYFYDSIAPVVELDSIDMEAAYRGSRYDVGMLPEGDYINCPLNAEEYYTLMNQILAAEKIKVKDFDKLQCFEGCQPIEVMVETGLDTLRHGPLKPMGLRDPRTGQTPYAVCQLRQDNLHGTLYNMVGFQSRMTYSEQDRVLRLIPALRDATFPRYGSMHRNTYINGPKLLSSDLMVQEIPGLYIAGQLSGVEGYLESAAMGLYVGLQLTSKRKSPPIETALGALVRHITSSNPARYQPMNTIWGIFPPPEQKMRKPLRVRYLVDRARSAFQLWNQDNTSHTECAVELL